MRMRGISTPFSRQVVSEGHDKRIVIASTARHVRSQRPGEVPSRRTQIVEATPFVRRDGGAGRRVVQFLHDLMPALRVEAAARAITPEQVEPLLEFEFHWGRGETQPASALGLPQEPVDQSRWDT